MEFSNTFFHELGHYIALKFLLRNNNDIANQINFSVSEQKITSTLLTQKSNIRIGGATFGIDYIEKINKKAFVLLFGSFFSNAKTNSIRPIY